MANYESLEFNPAILHSLRTQLAYSASEVARLCKVPIDRYNDLEAGEAQPKSGELKKFAKFFRVKEFSFFRRSAPSKSKDINFRAHMPQYKGEPGPILDAIEFASGIQRLLISVADTRSLRWTRNERSLTLTSDVEQEAGWWRQNLEIEDTTQLEIPSHDKFFMFFRSRIEQRGISVLVYSFDEKAFKGLTYGSKEDIPVILINSFKQQKSSRTFTLAHELGHVLLGEDGVSNPYEPATRVERFCNKFAAAILMPKRLISLLLDKRKGDHTSNSTIKWLSNKLKVSMEAVVIRLIECGYATGGFWQSWKSQFKGYLPSEEDLGGGGGSEEGVDQGLVKLAHFGFLFGQLVPDRFRENGLTGMAVFKASRLKPGYLPDLSRAAKQRLSEVRSYDGT
ncbi:MAG: ImmA/IrrE family metallo-endopeptidase [Hyphomicrobiales bacterium]|nr:MAG: ImmA/IrrE family metallo-endopeptidase [Hyphomicrobiales bacterium]